MQLEASILITDRAGWQSLPQANEMVATLIELECNLSLLNAISNSSATFPPSSIVERCDRCIEICDAAKLGATSTITQVHSLKFATQLQAKDYSACHLTCLDKRNQDFERRKGMMSRLAVKMTEDGKLEALCSSIPMIVMTGKDDGER